MHLQLLLGVLHLDGSHLVQLSELRVQGVVLRLQQRHFLLQLLGACAKKVITSLVIVKGIMTYCLHTCTAEYDVNQGDHDGN